MLFLFGLPLFPASLHVSRLIVLVVVVFLLIAPLSHLVLFLLPRPPRALEKENNGRNIFHFVCLSGIFANMSFHRIIVSFFSLGDFFHPQNMCLFHVLGLCFDGVTDSSLLLISRCFAFGCLEHNLLSVQLVSCACIVWICCLLSWRFSFFWCFFCLSGVFLLGFWFVSFQCSSSSWDSLSLIVLS